MEEWRVSMLKDKPTMSLKYWKGDPTWKAWWYHERVKPEFTTAEEIAKWSEPHWGALEGDPHGMWRSYTYDERLNLAQMALDHVPEGGLMVEIGCYGGLSLGVLLQVARIKNARVLAIDNLTYFGWASEWHLRHTLCQFPDVWWRFYMLSSKDTKANLESAWPVDFADEIHLLHIDGDHNKADEDFELWGPNLVSGGVVAFHDCIHPVDGPVNAFTKVWYDAEKYTHGWQEVYLKKENWLLLRVKP